MNTFEEVQYVSDDDSSPILIVKTRKKKAANRTFMKVSEYDTPEESIQAIQLISSYSKLREFDTKDGIKVEYRCNKVKLRGPQCASSI